MGNKNIVKVCAWCNDKKEKDLEVKKNGKSVTHGVCKECYKTLFEVYEKTEKVLS